MGSPFEASAASQTTAFFKIETVQQRLVVGPPRSRSEIHVPIHDVLWRLRLGRQPAAHLRAKPARMRVHRLKLPKLAKTREVNREHEIGQAAPLRPGLENAA